MFLGLGAAAVFGVAIYLLVDRGDSEPVAEASDAPGRSRTVSVDHGGESAGGGFAQPKQLSKRVAKLEDEVKALRRELKLVRAAAGMQASRSGSELDPEEPAFEGTVREIIEADREEEREREMEQRKQRWEEMTREVLAELRDEAGVNDAQSEEIAGLWKTESEQVFPIFAEARAGERPISEARADVEKFRSETDKAVEKLLTKEQFEKYTELRPTGRRGRRGGRRGPPG